MKLSIYFTAVLVLFALFKVSAQSCTGCSTSISGNDTLTYNVVSGQVLCITGGGNFLGNITINGGTVCVSPATRIARRQGKPFAPADGRGSGQAAAKRRCAFAQAFGQYKGSRRQSRRS